MSCGNLSLEKPSFKTSFLRRRCLIPANGFYEWRKTDKQPFLLRQKGIICFILPEFMMPGMGPTAVIFLLWGAITTSANDFIQPLRKNAPFAKSFII